MQNSGKFPLLLLVLYVILCVVLAFGPFDREIWFAENLTVWIIVGTLIVLWVSGIRFSNLSYFLMSILIFLHTIGGHYTFEKVPFQWFNDLVGSERNNYDRVAHFSVGLYAFAVAEWLSAKKLVANRFLLFTYPVFLIGTIALSYEIIEWVFAVNAAPEAGAAYLGSQGDIWDAQKDMLMDTLGAITAVILYSIIRKPKKD